jgi:hypothetical protein
MRAANAKTIDLPAFRVARIVHRESLTEPAQSTEFSGFARAGSRVGGYRVDTCRFVGHRERAMTAALARARTAPEGPVAVLGLILFVIVTILPL